MSFEESLIEEELQQAKLGERFRLTAPIRLAEYDPAWPTLFADEAGKIRAALGQAALRVEHAGSTAVPGLSAKPIIDMVLVVADSAAEAAYIPGLEGSGYVLRFREPDWYEHRMLKKSRPDVNLHVFSAGCPEVDRMLLFRDWLRHDGSDRRLYESVKRDLIARDWKFMQDYADAKVDIVREIMMRAQHWAELRAREAPA